MDNPGGGPGPGSIDNDELFERLLPQESEVERCRPKKIPRAKRSLDAADIAVVDMALAGEEQRAQWRATLKRMRWAFGR